MFGIKLSRIKTKGTRLETCSRIGKKINKLSRVQKIIFIVLACFIILPGSILVIAELGGYGQNGPATAPNSLNLGLVGYWDMEEGSGQVVKDKSGSGNNGTLGADSSVGSDDPVFVLGHDSSGETGTGLQFNSAQSNYVQVPFSTSLDTGIKNNFSMDAWVYHTSSNNYGDVILERTYIYSFYIAGNQLRFYGAGLSTDTLTTDETIPFNKWTHVAVSYNGSVMNLYIDGVLKETANITGSLATGGQTTYISRHGVVNFNGTIDSVHIYNRAITEDEIRLLYNQKKPILQLKMDEGSGTTLYDDSFNNRDAKIYNKINTAASATANTLYDNDGGLNWTVNYWASQQVSIVYGTGVGQTRTISSNTSNTLTVSQNWTINPDNTSRYVMTLPDPNLWTERNSSPAVSLADVGYVGFASASSPVSGTGSFSLESWVKTSSSSDQYIMQQRGPGAVDGEYGFEIKGGKVHYYDYYGSYGLSFYSIKIVNDNNWHHVVFTREGSVGSIYIDGVLDATSDTVARNISSALVFAVGVDFRDTSSYFNGSIDDVRVYNYARTVDEVKADYNERLAADLGKNNQNLNKGLIGYWDFEEGQGQTVKDKSGNGNDCTLGSSPSVDAADPVFAPGFSSSGPKGTGIKFDGIDDTVNCGSSATLNPNTAITVQAFVYIPSNSNYQNILSRGWNGAGAWTLETGGGKWSFGVKNQSSGYYNVQSSSSILTGKWQQVVGVWDGVQVRIYVNGVLQGSTNTTGAIGIDASLSMVGGSLFNGTLDEVRIYNRALSEDEIRMLYNQKKPILEMKFDEGSGTIAHDESFNNNDGTLGGDGLGTDLPTWAAGKNGGALSFDGNNDYVNAGNVLNMGLSDYTLSAWFKESTSSSGMVYGLVGKSKANNDNGRYTLIFENGLLEIIFSVGGPVLVTTPETPYLDNNWHLATATFSRDGDMILYVDGIRKGSADISPFASTDMTTSASFFVGAYQDSTGTSVLSGSSFPGSIDGVRVYNYARTADEVLVDYNDGQAAHLGQNNQNLNNGLVGYWDMEEGGGQTVKDKSGSGNDRTIGSSSSVDSADPVFAPGFSSSGAKGTGLSFDGINDRVNCGAVWPSQERTQFSGAFWVKFNSFAKDQGLVSKGSSWTPNSGYQFFMGANKSLYLNYRGNNGGNYGIITDWSGAQTNQWYHIGFTFNSSNSLIVYINGRPFSTLSITIPMGVESNNLLIGYMDSGSGKFLNGSIDDVRIYNRTLSADEIRTIYNQKKPVLQLKMDEGSGTTAKDESFNNNDGTLGGDGVGTDLPAWVQGKWGSALSFDGSDDYISVPNSSSVSIGRMITLEAWVKYGGYASQWSPIFWKDGSYSLDLWTTGSTPRFGVAGGEAIAPSSLQIGVWTHLAGTYDGANVRLYMNGIQVGSQARTGNITTNSNPLYMGVANGWEYHGLIDDARIYDYARSASEVLTDYNDGQAAHLR